MNLSIGLNRLTRKYNMFMKGKDAQSLERLFVRKLSEIDRLIETNEIYKDVYYSQQKGSDDDGRTA